MYIFQLNWYNTSTLLFKTAVSWSDATFLRRWRSWESVFWWKCKNQVKEHRRGGLQWWYHYSFYASYFCVFLLFLFYWWFLFLQTYVMFSFGIYLSLVVVSEEVKTLVCILYAAYLYNILLTIISQCLHL